MRWLVWGVATCLMAAAATANLMHVEGFNWTAGDFLVMGMMLSLACSIYELGAKLSASTFYRAGFGLCVLTGFLTAWITLAVGIISEAQEQANVLFGAVLLVGIVGSLLARFRPQGMARASFASAVTQAVVAAIAAAIEPTHPEGWIVSGCLAGMWLAAAALFRRSARSD
ncbi:MAG: hypothetical protein ABI588_10155 [Arenimonas sp.]